MMDWPPSKAEIESAWEIYADLIQEIDDFKYFPPTPTGDAQDKLLAVIIGRWVKKQRTEQ